MRTLTIKPYLAITLLLALSVACVQAQFTFDHIGTGATGSLTPNAEAGSFTLIGGGDDIWDTTDNFDFAHGPVTGDFDIRVRVESLEFTATWTKAGIMARESMATDSRMAFNRVTPSTGANDSRFAYRTGLASPGANGGQHEDGTGAPGYPNAWLRLVRQGAVFTAYATTDGLNWREQGRQNTVDWQGGAIAASLEVGLGVSRHSGADTLATCEFRDYGNAATTPAAISTQPANTSAEEGFTATFRFSAPGGFDLYDIQWRKNGVDIPGATSPSYTTPTLAVSASGTAYSVAIRQKNNNTTATSADAILTVVPDTTKPTVVSVGVTSGIANRVVVTFSEPVNQGDAQNLANYTLSGFTASAAALQADNKTVYLTTPSLATSGCKSLAAQNIRDRASTPNAMDPSTPRAFIYTDGVLRYNEYTGIGGGTVADLTSNAKFPNQPDVTSFVTSMENPNGGNGQGDNYGGRMVGYLTPAASGAYTFYIAADDGSVLYLSTDENPANKVPIATEPVWSGFRTYTGEAGGGGRTTCAAVRPMCNISLPVNLVCGNRYYIEGLWKEGGGGDHMSVAWQPPGDPNVPTGPIPGAYLSPLNPSPITLAAAQPADQTISENQNLILNINITAGTPAYVIQWFKNGSPIPGANGTTYRIDNAKIPDSGSYMATVQNSAGLVSSRTANVNIIIDTVAPSLVSASAPAGNGTQFDVLFTEPINQTDAQNVANYSIPGVTLNTAVLQADNKTVRITSSSLYGPGCRVLTANNIRDRAIPPNTLMNGSVGVRAAKGNAVYKQWNGMADTVFIGRLTSDPRFPDSPDRTVNVTRFENPAGGGGEGDNYGAQITGYFHPLVTGDHIFHMAADDTSALWLSTDENPANKVMIAKEPEWTNYREWVGDAGGRRDGCACGQCDNVSKPIHLNAGCRYYMELIYKEVGGGDHGAVLARLASDPPPANGAVSIGPESLSPLDPVTPPVENGQGPLAIAAAGSSTLDRATITFNEALGVGSEDPFNFLVTGGSVAPGVIGSSISADRKTVLLQLDPMTPLELNAAYTVTAFNVADAAGNATAETSASFHSVVEGFGGAIFETYPTGGGVFSCQLNTHPSFPNSPDFRMTIPGMDSRAAYSGDGRDNYGARIRGVYVPPYSAKWVFYLRADDAAELYFNPNGPEAAGARMISWEWGCCQAFEAIPSEAISLIGGHPYYIEMRYKEGGGGDYGQVAARPQGSTDPLTPIGPRDMGQYTEPGFSGSLVVTGPTDQTIQEGRIVTFTVSAVSSLNLPIGFQWLRDGVPIAGATDTSYSFRAVAADQGAVFSVRAATAGNVVNSASATLTVLIDTQGPRVVSVVGLDTFENVVVSFDEQLDPPSADPFNFEIPGLNVTAAALGTDGASVRLTTSPQTPGATYTVNVGEGVTDTSVRHNVVDPAHNSGTFTAASFYCGVLVFEAFNGIGGVAVPDLTNNPAYPFNPSETRYINTFDTAAAFGTTDYRNDFGGRVHGVFIPPASGNWIFYLRSDDASELNINPTGVSPAGKVNIALEPGCCGPFSAHFSAPIPLVAGQQYFIEGIYKEGGGGDYIQVAAKLDTDSTPPDTLKPLGASVLGHYGNASGAQIHITQNISDQTVCLNPLDPAAPSASFTVAASATPDSAPLLSENFNSGNGGFTVQTDSPFAGPWVYDAAGGVWHADGQDPDTGGPSMTSRLTSPAIAVSQAGVVKITFSHRWSFEPGWDGGQVLVSVNGGPFTMVPVASFTEGPYNGSVLGNSASILHGQNAFINQSAGHASAARINSTADLANVAAGDTIKVQFLYAADSNTRGAVPNWEIDSLNLTQGGQPSLTTLVQWQRNNGAGWSDIGGAIANTYRFEPKLADNGAKFRALISSPGSACITSAEATLSVIQQNTPPAFDLGAGDSNTEDGPARSILGFASNIKVHSIPQNTMITFERLPPNSDLYSMARIADGRAHLTDAGQGSAYGALGLNLPAVQTYSTFEVDWKSYLGDGAGGGADGYSLNIGTDLAGDPGYGGEEGKGAGLTITVDTFNNADLRNPDEGIQIKWAGQEVAFMNIPKDNPGNGIYLRKSAFVDAKLTVDAAGLATLTYDGQTISGPLPGYAGITLSRLLFWARTGGANDNQWIDNLTGSEWIGYFLSDAASVENGQTVHFEVSNNNPGLFSQQPAISPNGTLTYALAPNACGQAAVTVVARDSGGTACNGDDASDPKTFTIDVTCVPDCPIATPQSVAAAAGVPKAITLAGTDADGDPLTAAIASNPSHGSLSVVGGVLNYTANAGYQGPDSFTFTVNDGTCTSPAATVSISVTADRPPHCLADISPADCGVTFPNNGKLYAIASTDGTICLALNGSGSTDPDGDPLTMTWVIDVTNTLSGPVVSTCFAAGCHTITLIVSDGTLSCQQQIDLCVVTPSEAVEQIITLVESTTVDRNNKRPLIVSLKAAKAAFETDSWSRGGQMLQVFQHKVKAQISKNNPAEAAMFDAAAEGVIGAVECTTNLPPKNE